MKLSKQISDKMKSEGRTKAWLAAKIGCTSQHTSLILLGRHPITDEKLKAINKALKTRFTHGKKKTS